MSEEKKETPAEGEKTAHSKPKGPTPAQLAAAEKKLKQQNKWTLEKCHKIAKRFATMEEWQTGAPSSFKAAAAKNWVTQCSSHFAKSTAKKGRKTA